jgi:hypothetical protein
LTQDQKTVSKKQEKLGSDENTCGSKYFSVISGWKKRNEELPGTELTGAIIERPKLKGSLEE